MGTVYLARDTKLARHVAIKVLHGDDGAGAESNRRLLREARAAARLDHPNICAIYEVGDVDGRAFIVMQLVEGETLEMRLRRGPVGVGEAVALGAEIADAATPCATRLCASVVTSAEKRAAAVSTITCRRRDLRSKESLCD
jgi:serine/threonine protein kinase